MYKTLNMLGVFLDFVSLALVVWVVLLLIFYNNWKLTFILGFVALYLQCVVASGRVGLPLPSRLPSRLPFS